MLGPGQLLLVYDGASGAWCAARRLLERADGRGTVAMRPWQTPGLLSVLGLHPREARRTVWALTPAGERLPGAAAIAAAADALAGLPLPLLSRLSKLPVVRGAAERAWSVGAGLRRRLPAGPPDLLVCDPPPLAAEERAELERRCGPGLLLFLPLRSGHG